MKILKQLSDVESYIEGIRINSDRHRTEFGFLPPSFYEDQASQNKLWISLDENGRIAGYLIFGGKRPTLKVFQLFVFEEFRGLGVSKQLIEELEVYGESKNYLSVKARVAADLRANVFWEKCGFILSIQVPGGKSAKRIINIRVKELNTPSLLEGMDMRLTQSVGPLRPTHFESQPSLQNSRYALDLNVFFDILKRHPLVDESMCVFSAGWNNVVRLCVTPEFVNELDRNSRGDLNDPLLAFARQIPQLRAVDRDCIAELTEELRTMIFPKRSLTGKKAINDLSDLTHLCYAIFHKVDGFVTRERAILKSRDELLARYGLDVLSPGDFVQSMDCDEDILVSVGDDNVGALQVSYTSRLSNHDVDEFLTELHVSSVRSRDIWAGETSGQLLQKVSVKVDGAIYAIASWVKPSKAAGEIVAYLFIQDDEKFSGKAVDHLLELLFREVLPKSVSKISLTIGSGQS